MKASDTGNAGYGSRWDQAENGVRMTDFQVFRLFRDGKAAANEYRAVYAGYNWWMRNLEYTFMSGFLYVSSGPISGWTSEHSFGVRPSAH